MVRTFDSYGNVTPASRTFLMDGRVARHTIFSHFLRNAFGLRCVKKRQLNPCTSLLRGVLLHAATARTLRLLSALERQAANSM